ALDGRGRLVAGAGDGTDQRVDQTQGIKRSRRNSRGNGHDEEPRKRASPLVMRLPSSDGGPCELLGSCWGAVRANPFRQRRRQLVPGAPRNATRGGRTNSCASTK